MRPNCGHFSEKAQPCLVRGLNDVVDSSKLRLTVDNSCPLPIPVCGLVAASSQSRTVHGLDKDIFKDRSRTWIVRRQGQIAVVVADWMQPWTGHGHGYGQTVVVVGSRTGHGRDEGTD